MKWQLIFGLSSIGLAMVLGGVFFVPPNLESVLWLVVWLYWAYAIAKHCRIHRFAHGFALAILDGIYITVFHDLFLTRYLGGHLHAQAMIELLHQQHVSGSARQILCITGAASSVFVGIVVGVFAVIAGMMMRPKRVDLTAEPQI